MAESVMGDDREKVEKKRAKAAVKQEKSRAKASREGGASGAAPVVARSAGVLPAGVGVSVEREGDGSRVVVSGLSDRQIRRLLPHVVGEVLIAVTADRSAFRAGFMRFVREGLFQTIVKVAAGLIVGYLLLRFGMR
jgi:hypothetical protein